MASKLDKHLKRGERVAFRAAGSWVPTGWFLVVAAVGLAIVGATVFEGYFGGSEAASKMLGIVLGTVVQNLGLLIWGQAELAVTERRVLIVTGGADKPDEIELSEIETVEAFANAVRVTKRGSEVEVLSVRRRGRAAAEAIAQAAGVAAPQTPPQRELDGERTLVTWTALLGAATAIVLVVWPTMQLSGYEILAFWLLVAPPTIFLATLAGGLYGLAQVRRSFTPAQMRRWLPGVDLLATAGSLKTGKPTWLARLFLFAADLLYGHPAQPSRRASAGGRVELLAKLGADEAVLYHAPRRWEPNAWPDEAALWVASLALLALCGILTLDGPGLFALAAVVGGPWLYTLGVTLRDWSREAVVSGRRLLYRSGWFRPETTEIDAASVAGVDANKDTLRIAREDGTIVELGHPQDAWSLGVALAHAAGTPYPRLPPRKEVLGEKLSLLLGMTAGTALGLVPLRWLYDVLFAAGDAPSAMLGLGVFAVFFLIGQVALVTGVTLAPLLAVALLRPFFSRAEMTDWLRHGEAFWPDTKNAWKDTWLARSARRLSDLLYGRLKRNQDNRSSDHGA